MKLVFFSFLFLSQFMISYGQVDFSKCLDSYSNKEAIKNNQIKSLIIYGEFNENGIIKRGSYSGKIAELEFDSNGYESYKITSNNHGNLPFVEYGRGSFIEIYQYDSNHLLISAYSENHRRSEQELKAYDSDGRNTSVEYIKDNDTVLKLDFKWEKEQMIGATILKVDEANTNRINNYDEKGRLLKASNRRWSQDYNYEEKNDTLITTVITRRSDTLFTTVEFSTLTKFDRTFKYVKRDHSEKTIVEMNAVLDQNGNATYYYLNDLRNKYHGDQTYPPTVYEIENTYDKNNLLIKREYYYSRDDVGKDILTKIERYCYDTDALPFKMAKGNLIEHYESEEMDDREGE